MWPSFKLNGGRNMPKGGIHATKLCRQQTRMVKLIKPSGGDGDANLFNSAKIC